MNAEQKLADQREKAQIVCSLLHGNQDALHEVSVPLIAARRAYDAIVMQGVDSVEVVLALMDSVAEAASLLDDILSDIWEIMEPEDERKNDVTADVDRAVEETMNFVDKAKAMYESYVKRTNTTQTWDALPPMVKADWIQMAERTPDHVEEGTAG